jgi:hypothetical protein
VKLIAMISIFAVLLLYGLIGMDWRRAMSFNAKAAALLFAMTVPLLLNSQDPWISAHRVLSLPVMLVACALLALASFYTGALLRTISLVTGRVFRRS